MIINPQKEPEKPVKDPIDWGRIGFLILTLTVWGVYDWKLVAPVFFTLIYVSMMIKEG